MSEREEYLGLVGQRAVAQANIERQRRQIGADPEVQRMLRVAAWLHVDRSRVRAVGDDLQCPEGWPSGVDSDAMIEANIDAALAGDSPGRRYSVVRFAADYISGAFKGADD